MTVIRMFQGTPEEPRLTNIPLLLRKLADRIEAGEYGDANNPAVEMRCACLISVYGERPIAFGFGATADPKQVFCDFHSGAALLMGFYDDD